MDCVIDVSRESFQTIDEQVSMLGKFPQIDPAKWLAMLQTMKCKPVSKWIHTVGSRSFEIELMKNGRINSFCDPNSWSADGRKLVLRWRSKEALEGEWVDMCLISDDGLSYEGCNQLGDAVKGVRLDLAKEVKIL